MVICRHDGGLDPAGIQGWGRGPGSCPKAAGGTGGTWRLWHEDGAGQGGLTPYQHSLSRYYLPGPVLGVSHPHLHWN